MPHSAAKTVYQYLSERSSLPSSPVDAIIGFGHFDLRIAHQCGQLWQSGFAPHIIFTGGIGAGSADLNQPEANELAEHLFAKFPDIPTEQVLLETSSTNTGENIRFLRQKAEAIPWPIQRVILVATPFRQRRVRLTWQAQGPTDSLTFNAPPPSTLNKDSALFATNGEDLTAQLPGEIDRLVSYAQRGWIAPESIPAAVISARRWIQS